MTAIDHSHAMPSSESPPGIFLPWFAMTFLGTPVAIGLPYALQAIDPKTIDRVYLYGYSLELTAMMAVSGMFIDVIIALAQASMVTRHFGVSRRAWIVATAVGSLLAWLFLTQVAVPFQNALHVDGEFSYIFYTDTFAGVVLSCGAVIGLLRFLPQWFTLRRRVGRAWIWLVAGALGWSLAHGGSVLLTTFWYDIDPSMEMEIGIVATLLLPGLAVGLLSAIAAALLNRRAPAISSAGTIDQAALPGLSSS